MQHEQTELEPSQLLSALLENLNVQFFADNRTDAKRLYQTINGGQQVPFMHIAFPNGGEIACDLALDHSQHVGKLSFGKFRKSLATMMQAIAARVEEKQDFNILNSQDGDMLFNIPGIIKSEGEVNVMISGMRQTAPGRATIRLLFLDPAQYEPLKSPSVQDALNKT